jgi:hypothetical protein
MLAFAHAAISLWDGLPKTATSSNLIAHFFTLCAILRFIVASAAEAKFCALFLNCKEEMIFQLTLEELGQPQPKTHVHCDNATAIGISNNTLKRKHSRSMEMRCDIFGFVIKFPRMHITLGGTQDKRILQTTRANTTMELTIKQCTPGIYMRKILSWSRATRPSTLKGCVGTLPARYIHT